MHHATSRFFFFFFLPLPLRSLSSSISRTTIFFKSGMHGWLTVRFRADFGLANLPKRHLLNSSSLAALNEVIKGLEVTTRILSLD